MLVGAIWDSSFLLHHTNDNPHHNLQPNKISCTPFDSPHPEWCKKLPLKEAWFPEQAFHLFLQIHLSKDSSALLTLNKKKVYLRSPAMIN